MSLAAGLKAAEKSGTPISAKFELEDIGLLSRRGQVRGSAAARQVRVPGPGDEVNRGNLLA